MILCPLYALGLSSHNDASIRHVGQSQQKASFFFQFLWQIHQKDGSSGMGHKNLNPRFNSANWGILPTLQILEVISRQHGSRRLCIGEGTGPYVIWDLCPHQLGPREQVGCHRRACTQVRFLRKVELRFFHFLEIVTGWLVPFAG